MNQELLQVKNLKKYFPINKGLFSKTVGAVKAVDGISFSILEGETFGLVGESGCGKSTTGRMILRLIEPTDGQVIYKGKYIQDLLKDSMKKLRREIQIIFQDPYSSLDPRFTIADTIGEVLEIHNMYTRKERTDRILHLLEAVGLGPQHINRYPHEFSGGQRQRIGIARALALNPSLLVCDEPVSALDVSVQAQIINLMQDLQKELKLTYLFISHDLSVVHHICDRIAVMYMGKIVETADKKTLFENPSHPYTQALLSAIPVPNPGLATQRIVLEGDIPSPAHPPTGCRFHTRCKFVTEKCKKVEPQLKDIGGGHLMACHL
ncbi:dipeptide ABC transporter ATP-binding protein [Fictibacillus sp. WQ 8-8]|uniref:ABC transporter ATP-binding protein n=1 Tax=Fictibacillus sp. WQ 8-8 TaxID=2938788 RepID=UPI00210A315F|nr:dipeptide ABC transporter ATP-binding protein [Fictibacillus sp. WQ 8-8]MCQ6266322.1 dipeptide ABC transporter ATP-binding protein [Fictibacillus sp. WQ 8-8]